MPEYGNLLNRCLESALNAHRRAPVIQAKICGSYRELWILFQILFPWELHQHLRLPLLLVETFLKLVLKCQCLCGETIIKRRLPWWQPVPTIRPTETGRPGVCFSTLLLACCCLQLLSSLCKMRIKLGFFCKMLWALQRQMFQKNQVLLRTSVVLTSFSLLQCEILQDLWPWKVRRLSHEPIAADSEASLPGGSCELRASNCIISP